MGLVELFAVGSFWFCVVCVLEFCWLLSSASYRNSSSATVSLILFILFLQFIGVNVIGTIFHNPYHIIAFLVLQFVIGTLYFIHRWRRLVRIAYQPYKEAWRKFLDDNSLPPNTEILPDNLKPAWTIICNEEVYDCDSHKMRKLIDVPQAVDYKWDIVNWIVYWEPSLLVYICSDLFIEIGERIYEFFHDFAQAMADRIFNTEKMYKNLDVPAPNKKNLLARVQGKKK